MAEKLLTLIQDTTGDEIYPNVKEDNLPPSVRDLFQEVDYKQDKLTGIQMHAVNSGITQYKVSTYDGYADEIAKKQNKITASTISPFSITEDNTGIDLHKITLNANGQLEVGEPVTQIPSSSWIEGELDNKQDTLVSGVNIKTINGQSILGSGDLPVSGGGGQEQKKYRHIVSCNYILSGTSYATFQSIRMIIENNSPVQFDIQSLKDFFNKNYFYPAYGTGVIRADISNKNTILYAVGTASDTQYDCTLYVYSFPIKTETGTEGTTTYVYPVKNTVKAKIEKLNNDTVVEL